MCQRNVNLLVKDISRAAERYKELQKEVKSNLDRMALWTAEAGDRDRTE